MMERLNASISGGRALARPRRSAPNAREITARAGHWLRANIEVTWIAAILLVSGLAHGINMFNFPFYENDEGTYVSQAWAVITRGDLAQYTYWYDHAPWGWFQIAGWQILTGGFYTFGTSIDSGRVFMLVLQVLTTFLVYRVARSISGSVVSASVASLAFALSAYGIYFHRRVLLDNIAAFWMMLSISLLVTGRLTLTRVWLSAGVLAVSILSKELTIFLVPVMAYLVFHRSHRSQRWFASVGWVGIVAAIVSTYPLMAALKNELFPAGTWLGGDGEHVSLIETLQLQASRENDAGIFDPNSGFWQETRNWMESEPLLVIGGTLCAIISILLIRRRPLAGIMGLMTLSLWAFIGRGGVVINFYLVPLLPLLALNLGLVLGMLIDVVLRVSERFRVAQSGVLGIGTKLATAGLCLALIVPGYNSDNLGFKGYPLTLWQNKQVEGQNRATKWIRLNIASESQMIIDAYMWLDLHDPPHGGPSYSATNWENAHWYWKADTDPEIRDDVFHDNWKVVDYIVPTSQMKDHGQFAGLMEIVNGALENSSVIASFDTGGYPVEVRRVNKVLEFEATEDPVLTRSWETYKARFIRDGQAIDPKSNGNTTSEGQSYGMLRAVYLDDRASFDEIWSWTQEHLQVRGDGLFAWHWGTSEGQRDEGVLDMSSATDADQDIALALLFASKRWDEPAYEQQALEILAGIWEQDTVEAGGQRIVVAGNWARGDGSAGIEDPVVNPSYLAPYAYRIFAEADPSRPWNELVDSSYDILARTQESPSLAVAQGLIPDWLVVDGERGELLPADQLGDRARLSSFDASRVPWRLAVDWIWFQDERAKAALESANFTRETLKATGSLYAGYNLDGSPAVDYEAISVYAGTIPALLFDEDKDLVHRVFAEHIFGPYNGFQALWGDPDNYFDQNWAWFTTLMMDGGLANLWSGETVVDWEAVFPER